MVFTCLSSDIIAHEMTHALLDGLHRRFQEASNPDVPAFHEAFADIVALFQHFTMPELVRFEIARTRGDLVGGEPAGRPGPAVRRGQRASRARCATTSSAAMQEPALRDDKARPHERGAILVSPVYDAFRMIVASAAPTT